MTKKELLKEDFNNICKEITEKFGKNCLYSFINSMLTMSLILHKEGNKETIEEILCNYDMKFSLLAHKMNATPEQKRNLFNVIMTGIMLKDK